MRNTIIAAAALAALVNLGSAQAGPNWFNGEASNGFKLNGRVLQGTAANGLALNGLSLNGASDAAATILLQGITLPGGATLNTLAR